MSAIISKLLFIALCLYIGQSHATDINRCTDLRTRRIVLTAEPCDPKTQRLVKVYEQAELDKRLSTFNGAALVKLQKNSSVIKSGDQNQQQQQQNQIYTQSVTAYRPPVQQQQPPVNQPHRDAARCGQINREKDSIDQRQRQGYTVSQGEYYRERLRQLSDQFTFFQCSGFDK